MQTRGAVFEVLAFESARSKKAVRRLFGLGDREDLDVVAASHLPVVV